MFVRAAVLLFVFCAAAAAAVPRPDHVVVVVEENHAAGQIIGNSAAPFINSLASNGANFDNFFALDHPSQPDYLNLFSGSNQGVHDDDLPGALLFTTPNLAAALHFKQLTFAGYSESLPYTGYTGETSGDYVRKHNPWVNWQSANPGGNTLPSNVNLSMSSFPSDFSKLPTVSFVVPNQINDMHDGSIAEGDAWLSSTIGSYNAWAKSHNSLLIVTWDEDDGSDDNRIGTIFSGAMVNKTVSHTRYDHFNLLRTISDMYGAAAPGAAASSLAISGIWKTGPVTVPPPPPSTSTRTFRKGANGYVGGHDTFLTSAWPTSTHGASSPIVAGGDTKTDALIRFDSLIGSASSQIPRGAKITSAKLSLTTAAGAYDGSTTAFALHRMLKDWNESSTWNTFSNGISPDGIESLTSADATVIPGGVGNLVTLDVTKSLQAWAGGAANYGWALLPLGTNAWRFDSDEFSSLLMRPLLQVSFSTSSAASSMMMSAVPEPAAGAMWILCAVAGLARLRRRRTPAAPRQF